MFCDVLCYLKLIKHFEPVIYEFQILFPRDDISKKKFKKMIACDSCETEDYFSVAC